MTTTPVGINGLTYHHSNAIHQARMNAVAFIAGLDTDTLRRIEPLLASWNDVNEHYEGLLAIEVAQRRYLEAYCRNLEAHGEILFDRAARQ